MDQVGRRIMCECVNGGNEHFYTRRRDYRASTCRDTVHKEQMSEKGRMGEEEKSCRWLGLRDPSGTGLRIAINTTPCSPA